MNDASRDVLDDDSASQSSFPTPYGLSPAEEEAFSALLQKELLSPGSPPDEESLSSMVQKGLLEEDCPFSSMIQKRLVAGLMQGGEPGRMAILDLEDAANNLPGFVIGHIPRDVLGRLDRM